jgi:hypothetical protein
MNRGRLDRLEKTLASSQCPDCSGWERVVLVERLMIVAPGDAPPLPTSEPPSPERCPRCGRDWSSQPRIVEEIRLDWMECQL